MKNVFILCNSENEKSNNYIQYGAAGSSLGNYLANTLGEQDDYCVKILNLGSPNKNRKSIKDTKIYDFKNYKIVEFKSFFKFVPSIFRAKTVLNEAVKYLKENFKDGDKILIYHSLYYSKKYSKIIKIAGLSNVVLFVAEIYSDASNKSISCRNWELRQIRLFNKYICMSKSLSDICCTTKNKKAIILYGCYSNKTPIVENKKNDKIHLVYSGTTSKTKNGLYIAIEAMRHLSQDFILHIYCQPVKEALIAIQNCQNVVYEGYVSESVLNVKLREYDIGLACQNPKEMFNNSSFPSKIVKYLSCGLSVISSASSSVLDSPFANIIDIFEQYNSKALAECIIKTSQNLHYNENIKIIQNFHNAFRNDVVTLVEE